MHNNIQTTIQSSKTKVGLLFALTGIVSLIAITFGFYSFINIEKPAEASSSSNYVTLERGNQICAYTDSNYTHLLFDGTPQQKEEVNKFVPNSSPYNGKIRIYLSTSPQCFTRPSGTGGSVTLVGGLGIAPLESNNIDSLSPTAPAAPQPAIPATPIVHRPSGNITLSTERQVLDSGQVCAYNVPANHLVAVGLSKKGDVNHVEKFERGSNAGGNVCFGNKIGYHFHFFIYNKDDGSLVTEGTVW
jgi:hypothetical protein